jgi:hypothetical protein
VSARHPFFRQHQGENNLSIGWIHQYQLDSSMFIGQLYQIDGYVFDFLTKTEGSESSMQCNHLESNLIHLWPRTCAGNNLALEGSVVKVP